MTRSRATCRILFLLCVALFSYRDSAYGEGVGKNATEMLREARECLYANPKEASSLASLALKLCDTSTADTISREATILYGEAEQLLGNFDLSIKILYDAESLVDSTDTSCLQILMDSSPTTVQSISH